MARKRPPVGASGPPRPLDVRLAEAIRKVERLQLQVDRKAISDKLRTLRVRDARTTARRR